MIIIEKNAQNFMFSKVCLYLQYRKKQLKLTIMKEENKTPNREKYRITIIFTDEITIEKFETEIGAMETIKRMKILFPKMFIGGAIEKKDKSWKVIWTLGNN